MIIDAHTHIGFGKAMDARPESLVRSMRKAGIGKALVFAGRINQCSTEALLEAIAPYRGTLYAIGAISPLATRPPLRRVDRWLATGAIRGLKFYPGYEYFYPYERTLRPYLRLLEKHGRPAIFHSGDTFNKVRQAKLKFAHPLHLDDLATDMPDLKIVMAHLGYPWIVDAAEVVYKNKNVYADCSGFVYGRFTAAQRAHFGECFRQFVRIAGTRERILFGTDWPISDQASYVRAAKTLAKEPEPFFSKNAAKLFGLA